jgi:ketosteroid isomerase-like protein
MQMHRSKRHKMGHHSWSFATALGCVLLFCTPLLRAQDGAADPLHTATPTELSVVKAVLVQEKAWNAGDLEGYVKGYKDSPDTLFIGAQISRGYPQILADYKRNYATRAAMGTLAFSELEVHALSDTFVVCLGKYHLDRPKRDGGNADGVFSLVLEKTPDGWKIVLDHTT